MQGMPRRDGHAGHADRAEQVRDPGGEDVEPRGAQPHRRLQQGHVEGGDAVAVGDPVVDAGDQEGHQEGDGHADGQDDGQRRLRTDPVARTGHGRGRPATHRAVPVRHVLGVGHHSCPFVRGLNAAILPVHGPRGRWARPPVAGYR
jgi:hypothetical protein